MANSLVIRNKSLERENKDLKKRIKDLLCSMEELQAINSNLADTGVAFQQRLCIAFPDQIANVTTVEGEFA